MAIQYAEVLGLVKELEDEYRKKHEACRNLRRYWHGDYWRLADAESHPIISIFRDFTARTSDVGPDIKLVHNLLQSVCLKYQSFFAPLPQIRVYPDPPETDRKRAQASTKERYLYGVWDMTNMTKLNSRAAWYLPLMGDVFHGIYPDFDTKLPVGCLRSPEYAYPVPTFDGSETAYIFKWHVRQSWVRRAYPNYQSPEESRRLLGVFAKRGQEQDPYVDLIEYSDDQEFSRWVDGVAVNRIQHDFGWNLFEHAKFIDVPDEIFGHGAVEQTVSLTEMGNALYSLMFQAVIENVFPQLVLEDPSKAPEEIEKGSGSVLPLNAGGKAYYLTPPVQSLAFYENFLKINEANVKEVSGMAPTNFGESPATSIVTGKAVNELQGAGAGTMVELVQGTGMGPMLEAFNEKAIRIGQTMFREEQINLYGMMPRSGLDLVPGKFSLSLKGSELVGGTHNEVVFQPAVSQHEKLVMWLQAKGGGLVSNQFIRNQIGISDSDAMDQEIFNEAIDQGVLGMILQQFMAQPEAGGVEAVEQQAVGLLAGATPPAHPLIASGPVPPPAAPGAPSSPLGQPAPGGPPPGAPQAAQGPSQAQVATPNTVTLDQAVAAFQSVQGVQGKVYLVGEIVQRQQTSGEIEVALTDKVDQNTLTDQLTQYHLIFHMTVRDPSEPFLEVTPGAQPRRGGAGQGSPEALKGVFIQ